MKEEQAINELPKDWKRVKVNDVCMSIVGGGTPSTQKPEYWQGEIPWISSADIYGIKDLKPRRNITLEAVKNSATNIFPKGGIVVVTRVGLGKLAVAPYDLCFSQDSQGLILKKDLISAEYALLVLHQEVQNFKHQSRGTTINGVTKKQLAELEIALPPLGTQQQIVSKIEELFSELDKGIEDLKTAQQQLKAYRQAVLKWAFEGKYSKGVDAWKRMNLKGASLKVVVGYVGPVTEYIVAKDGVPFLSTTHIGENEFLFHDIREVSDGFNEKNKKSQVIPGDILIARHGDSGKSCIVPDSITIAQVSNAVILRPNPQIVLSKFVCYRLNSERQRMQKMKVGGVFQVVNTKSMEAFEISIPPIKEQQQIVQEIEGRLSVCDKIEETITDSLKQAAALRQSILKKAFEGKLA